MVLDVIYSMICLGLLGLIAYAIFQGIFGKDDYNFPWQNEQDFLRWREHEKWEERRDL